MRLLFIGYVVCKLPIQPRVRVYGTGDCGKAGVATNAFGGGGKVGGGTDQQSLYLLTINLLKLYFVVERRRTVKQVSVLLNKQKFKVERGPEKKL